MFRKMMLFSLVVALMLMGLCSMASAAQNVTNTSQKGSLLIFPKIDTSAVGTSGFYRDTIVMIGNDYFTEVWVKCYWVDSDQNIEDFMFRLSPNQPVWFRASDGAGTGYYDDVNYPVTVPPFHGGAGVVGELKCWAVDAVGQNQKSFNHLYGNAIVIDPVNGAAYEYNAWSFTARAAFGANVGTPGDLVLSGAAGGYDACPSYLVANFFSKESSINLGEPPQFEGFATFINTDLTLVPCHQDLRQDRTPTCTKARFDIWNENETKYTGAYQCLKCWFEGYLGDIGHYTIGYGGEKFWYKNLHTTAGRFRVQGIPSSVCKFGNPAGPFAKCPPGNGVASPLLGVISTEISFSPTGELNALVGTTPNTAGTGATTHILWDFQEQPPEAPAR